MRKHVKILALGGLLALVLSGCVKLDMDLELQSDDTIDGSMILAVSRQLAELSGTDPAELAEQMREEALSGEGMPEGSSVETYEDDDFVGSEVTFEGAPLDAFSDEDSLRITRDGDDFVVAGEMDLTDTSTEGLDLMSGVDIRIAITFPGAVSDADGEIDGRTVTWVAEPGEITTFNARGAAEAGALAGSLLWLVVGGVALLVVVLVVVLLVVRSRRKAAPATAPAGAYDASTHGTGDQAAGQYGADQYGVGQYGAPTQPTAFQPGDPAQAPAPHPTEPTQPGQPPVPPTQPPATGPDQGDQGHRPQA